MFLCDFLVVFITIVGHQRFSRSDSVEDNFVYRYIQGASNLEMMPILMLFIEFILIIVDRIIYLRKSLRGKFVFLIVEFFVLHLWLIVVYPIWFNRSISENWAAVSIYICKSIYFMFSALQIRTGFEIELSTEKEKGFSSSFCFSAIQRRFSATFWLENILTFVFCSTRSIASFRFSTRCASWWIGCSFRRLCLWIIIFSWKKSLEMLGLRNVIELLNVDRRDKELSIELVSNDVFHRFLFIFLLSNSFDLSFLFLRLRLRRRLDSVFNILRYLVSFVIFHRQFNISWSDWNWLLSNSDSIFDLRSFVSRTFISLAELLSHLLFVSDTKQRVETLRNLQKSFSKLKFDPLFKIHRSSKVRNNSLNKTRIVSNSQEVLVLNGRSRRRVLTDWNTNSNIFSAEILRSSMIFCFSNTFSFESLELMPIGIVYHRRTVSN